MSQHPVSAILAAVLAGLLAVVAVFPDPAQPAIVPLGGVLGSFINATVARLRRLPAEQVKAAALDGAYYGTGLAIGLYLIALVAGV